MLKIQKSRSASRLVALTIAAAITTMALVPAQSAHAADSKSYKYGAIGLGVLGAVLLSKGKTVEGAAALGGGYLAYKKAGSDRDEELRDERRADRWDRRNDRWNRNDYRDNNYRNNDYQRPIYPEWNNGRSNTNNDRDCDDNNRFYTNGKNKKWER